jgi:hypothetical protein
MDEQENQGVERGDPRTLNHDALVCAGQSGSSRAQSGQPGVPKALKIACGAAPSVAAAEEAPYLVRRGEDAARATAASLTGTLDHAHTELERLLGEAMQLCGEKEQLRLTLEERVGDVRAAWQSAGDAGAAFAAAAATEVEAWFRFTLEKRKGEQRAVWQSAGEAAAEAAAAAAATVAAADTAFRNSAPAVGEEALNHAKQMIGELRLELAATREDMAHLRNEVDQHRENEAWLCRSLEQKKAELYNVQYAAAEAATAGVVALNPQPSTLYPLPSAISPHP